MRAVGLSDLDVAARALLALPPDRWADMADGLVRDAHVADLWRKRFGTAHPSGGTGSLYAQATLGQTVPSSDCTPHYCAALREVLRALEARRKRANAPDNHKT